MKTLKEVIDTAPYIGTGWTNEALYYLKKFQELKEQEREREEKFNKLFKETYISFPDFMDLVGFKE